jgi:hypothetical protein
MKNWFFGQPGPKISISLFINSNIDLFFAFFVII